MVRRASPCPEAPARSKGPARGRSGLGPRGHAIFERLFGAMRATPEPAPPVSQGRLVAVASGKGGTGKSFLSTSLAVVLHQLGHRVTLVDCDFGLACDHLLLGVKPTYHLHQLLTGKAELDDVRCTTPAGPSLVPGVTGMRQMTVLAEHELRALGQALGELASTEDVVLLDTGAGLTPQNVLSLLVADHVVLVTQPEIAALTDAYAVIKTLVQLCQSPSISVVVNRVLEPGHGKATFEKLADVSRRHTGLSLGYLGPIDEDPTVTQRRLGQQPIVYSDPRRPTSCAIRAIARKLGGFAGPLEPRRVEAQESVQVRFEEYQRIV